MERKFPKLHRILKGFISRQDGGDTVEYVLLISLIAFGTVAGTHAFARSVDNAFSQISGDLAGYFDNSLGGGGRGHGGGPGGGGPGGGGPGGGGGHGHP